MFCFVICCVNNSLFEYGTHFSQLHTLHAHFNHNHDDDDHNHDDDHDHGHNDSQDDHDHDDHDRDRDHNDNQDDHDHHNFSWLIIFNFLNAKINTHGYWTAQMSIA